MKNRNYSHLTQYHNLYAESYWGRFKVEESSDIDEVVANRNKFAEQYGLDKYMGLERPINPTPIFDHCELYRQRNGGYVYITSPYDHFDGDKAASELGFIRYDALYSKSAVTYLKVFSSKIEFNRFLKKASRDN